MEITITKTFIGVLSTLTQSFIDMKKAEKRDLSAAPFIIKNYTGRTVRLNLRNKGFMFYMRHNGFVDHNRPRVSRKAGLDKTEVKENEKPPPPANSYSVFLYASQDPCDLFGHSSYV